MAQVVRVYPDHDSTAPISSVKKYHEQFTALDREARQESRDPLRRDFNGPMDV